METAIIRRKRKGDGRWMQLVTEGRVGPEADVEARREEPIIYSPFIMTNRRHCLRGLGLLSLALFVSLFLLIHISGLQTKKKARAVSLRMGTDSLFYILYNDSQPPISSQDKLCTVTGEIVTHHFLKPPFLRIADRRPIWFFHKPLRVELFQPQIVHNFPKAIGTVLDQCHII